MRPLVARYITLSGFSTVCVMGIDMAIINGYIIAAGRCNSITSFHDQTRSHICPANRYLCLFVCDVIVENRDVTSSPMRASTIYDSINNIL